MGVETVSALFEMGRAVEGVTGCTGLSVGWTNHIAAGCADREVIVAQIVATDTAGSKMLLAESCIVN
ncbi:hypothetical protein [Haloarchaeobius salinus]|uniref:hypothetical protein n=1 Tax=Haloarchaeobius salinus TaxID=1198298 RepID=UPI0021090AE2|nr:hypothetical protein [Haloarchaeobius salinus]